MRTSSYVVAAGAALFALPIPGTFVTGGLTIAAGAVGRAAGY